MSTLGYSMPHSQYGMNHYGSSQSSYSSGYPPASQQGYSDSRSSTTGGYASSYASSPGHQYEQQRIKEEQSVLPPYQPQHPSYSHSSYQQQQQQPLDSIRSSSSAGGYSYPAPHSNLPSQSMESNPSAYPPPALYPPTTYGLNDYRVSLPTMYPASSTTPAAYPAYEPPRAIPSPPNSSIPALPSSPNAQNSSVMPRVLNSRPKPQCFEHGCNGRQFSTFSNLLRHQREKSGTAMKSQCPKCHAEFTRTTAMKGHMQHDKCKARRPSEASNISR